MTREWKPGDVALWTNPSRGVPLLMFRHVDIDTREHEWRTATEGDGYPSERSILRPLAVIDPEDSEQVERLRSRLEEMSFSTWACGAADCLRIALREFADPKPPKPEEPTGLGAVVVDSNDVTYVRAGRLSPDGFFLEDCWRAVDGPIVGDWKRWDRIAAVRVLSEGVSA